MTDCTPVIRSMVDHVKQKLFADQHAGPSIDKGKADFLPECAWKKGLRVLMPSRRGMIAHQSSPPHPVCAGRPRICIETLVEEACWRNSETNRRRKKPRGLSLPNCPRCGSSIRGFNGGKPSRGAGLGSPKVLKRPYANANATASVFDSRHGPIAESLMFHASLAPILSALAKSSASRAAPIVSRIGHLTCAISACRCHEESQRFGNVMNREQFSDHTEQQASAE